MTNGWLGREVSCKISSSIWFQNFKIHAIGNHCTKYEHHYPKMKKNFALWAVRQILVYLTLAFWPKVISVFWNVHFHLNAINSLCAKYEHHLLTINKRGVRGVRVMSYKILSIFGPRREKTCLRWFANNKGTDQHVHPRSLISAFVVCLLESIIFKLATSKISIF